MRHACSKAALLQRRMRGSLCTQAGDERSVSLPLRPQLVCDLCGDSFGGAQLRFYLCGVSPYGAGDPGCNLLVVVSINGRQGRRLIASKPSLG